MIVGNGHDSDSRQFEWTPTYFMSVFTITSSMWAKDGIHYKRFLIGGSGRGSHLIRWKVVSWLVKSRGLGIGKLRLHNEAFLAMVKSIPKLCRQGSSSS